MSRSARCRVKRAPGTTGLGHEERFPLTRLSAGYGFRKETIAGMRRNGRDAPKTVAPKIGAGPDSLRCRATRRAAPGDLNKAIFGRSIARSKQPTRGVKAQAFGTSSCNGVLSRMR